MRKIIAVDIDRTLTRSVSFTNSDVRKAVPIPSKVRKVNKLYETNYIIIYTARRNHLVEATLNWLKKHDIHYHAFSNHKIPFDIYLDDDAHPL